MKFSENRLHESIKNWKSSDVTNNISKTLENRIIEVFNTKSTKMKTPKILHFIWFGEMQNEAVEYLKVWKKCYPDYRVKLWYDGDCFLSGELKNFLQQVELSSSREEILTKQNNAYCDITYNDTVFYNIDESIVNFLRVNRHNSYSHIIIRLNKIKRSIINLSNHFELENIRDLIDKSSSLIKKAYHLEQLLRGNFAAASDIARILILEKYGGFYIDVDTLPSFNKVFLKTNEYISQFQHADRKVLEAYKIDILLKNICKNYQPRINLNKEVEKIINNDIYNLDKIIIRDIESARIKNTIYYSSNKFYSYDNLISISTCNDFQEYFFSNIIGCHKNSKLIRIIKMEMMKRYKFLYDNNAIFSTSIDIDAKSQSLHFYGRLLAYRFDEFKNSNFVTIPLTGPGLYVEVILGIACSICHVNDDISLRLMSYLLTDPTIGIGFSNQSFNTPLSINSTWMNNF